MRPGRQEWTGEQDLFQARLDQIINMKHELVRLAQTFDWPWMDEQVADCFSENGRPGLPTRFMVGLLLLKQIYGLSDELVCERWVYDPYFQYFTGAEFFAHEFPHERSGISHWRKRIGDKLDALLAKERDDLAALMLSWESLYHYSRGFGDNVHSATASLMKWTGLTAIFSSIMGAGGLFGIDRLAQSVSSDRRTAAAYGNTYGEQQSFQANFARLGDAGTNLSWITDLMTNPQSRGYLGAIAGSQGLANQISTEDPARAFADILPHLKTLVDSFPKQNFARMAQAYGIPLGLANIIHGMSPDELNSIVSGYRSSANPLNLPPAVLRKWNDLNATLETAGGTIETAFENKLVALTPGVGDLAKSFGDLLTYVMRDGGDIDKWLRSAGGGLQKFDDSLQTKGFDGIVQAIINGLNATVFVIEELVAHPRDFVSQVAAHGVAAAVGRGLHAIGVPKPAAKAAAKKIEPVLKEGIKEGLKVGAPVAAGVGKVLSATGASVVAKDLWSANTDFIRQTAPGVIKKEYNAGKWLWNKATAPPDPMWYTPGSKTAPPSTKAYSPSYLRSLDGAPVLPKPKSAASPYGNLSGAMGLHPNARHHAREAAKPSVVVHAPAGMAVTPDSAGAFMGNVFAP